MDENLDSSTPFFFFFLIQLFYAIKKMLSNPRILSWGLFKTVCVLVDFSAETEDTPWAELAQGRLEGGPEEGAAREKGLLLPLGGWT